MVDGVGLDRAALLTQVQPLVGSDEVVRPSLVVGAGVIPCLGLGPPLLDLTRVRVTSPPAHQVEQLRKELLALVGVAQADASYLTEVVGLRTPSHSTATSSV